MAVLLFAATLIETSCGDTYRPVATVAPTNAGDPSGSETEAVLQCCLDPSSVNAVTTSATSVLTAIDVSGDMNGGNKVLGFKAASAAGPVSGSVGQPIVMDYNRTIMYTASTANDSVALTTLNSSATGFSSYNATISLPTGTKPIGLSFQYYNSSYSYMFVVNSGTSSTICPGTGSLGIINQSTDLLLGTVCLGSSAAPSTPVDAWIFRTHGKVFVLSYNASGSSTVYVVNTTSYKVTNTFTVGKGAVKMGQSVDGNYIYTLNNTDKTISIIDAVNEDVVGTVSTANSLSSAAPVDLALDMNYNDTTSNTQYNHVWVLLADGTVSVYDNTTPGSLTWVTSMSTITDAQLTAGIYPTNIAMLRDGTEVYVGLGNSDKIAGIDTSMISQSAVTSSLALTSVTVGVHRSTSGTMTDTASATYTVAETTTPIVNFVAVSRQGTGSNNSAVLSKAYASTVSTTVYSYYDANGNAVTSRPEADSTPTWCTDSGNTTTCANLYNGTAVVTGAANGSTPINTYVTTISSPAQVTYCTAPSTDTDGQKECPLTTPTFILGRN
ncbi:MAG: hypothetical protein P4M01_01305 [Acidobacteriota bacterium]|nr:hypothetical protein [Acidobacteriota bacterium]